MSPSRPAATGRWRRGRRPTRAALIGYAERIRLAARDLGDWVSGGSTNLTPPRRLQLRGGRGDFASVGQRWLEILVDHGGLGPESRVLDIGCGPGRIALPLTRYLRGGLYEGFDVSRPSVRWCQASISPRFPSFTFRLADVENRMYNRQGVEASSYTFPYLDASFDVAIAASVFTHMTPDGVARYLREAGRCLSPGGRLVSTFFLLTGEDQPGAQGSDEVPYELSDRSGRYYRASDPESPEFQIAIPEADVRDMHRAAGLRITSVEYGRWSCPERTRGRRQDLVVAERARLLNGSAAP